MFDSGRSGSCGGESICLGLTSSVETGGLCCSGVGGGWLGPGFERVRWCYVCLCCDSGLFVLMAGPGICILC